MAVLIRATFLRRGGRLCPFRRYAVLALLVCGGLLLSAPRLEAAPVGEYQVKAAMVYNLTKYVEWPADLSAGVALNLCDVGHGALGRAMDSLQGLELKGRKILVRQSVRTEELGSCQVIVVSEAEKRQLVGIFESVAEKEILTVSDLPRFALAGGMVGLVAEGGRVKFEINLAAAKRARIKISSQLLKLARIVQGDER